MSTAYTSLTAYVVRRYNADIYFARHGECFGIGGLKPNVNSTKIYCSNEAMFYTFIFRFLEHQITNERVKGVLPGGCVRSFQNGV